MINSKFGSENKLSGFNSELVFSLQINQASSDETDYDCSVLRTNSRKKLTKPRQKWPSSADFNLFLVGAP